MYIPDNKAASFLNALKSIKGSIYKGSDFNKMMTRMMYPDRNFAVKYSVKKHLVDCTHTDESGNKINEYYVHIEPFDESYTDILCIINNTEDPEEEWIIYIKDITTQY